MSSELTQANKYFLMKDYDKALDKYYIVIKNLNKFSNVPSVLLKQTQKRIDLCQKFLNIELSNPSMIDLRAKNSDYTIKYFFNTINQKFLPKISIVIPHYKSKGLIWEALDSIQNQSFHEIETIIIDDFSNDNLLIDEKIKKYSQWMQISIIKYTTNVGPSICRNKGIEFSKGRAVCFLDADDYLDKKTLESRWNIINRDPFIAGTFSTMTYVSEQRLELGPVILKGFEKILFTDFLSNKFPCSALMIRKSFLTLDYFDEKIKFGEDYELFSRLAQRGGIYQFAPEGTIYYRQHKNSITHKDTITDLGSRITVTKQVHTRILNWSLVNYTRTLPEAVMIKEISLRAFPVICIIALRGMTKKALEMGKKTNPDLIASTSSRQISSTIKFFLAREELVKTSEVENLIMKLNKFAFLDFLNQFFHTRHNKFISNLLFQIYSHGIGKVSDVLTTFSEPSICQVNISDLFTTNLYNGNAYIALTLTNETISTNSLKQVSKYFGTRSDLEGVFAYKVKIDKDNLLTDINSIAPDNSDSIYLSKLGEDSQPGLILKSEVIIILKEYLVINGISGENNESEVYMAVLKSIFTLRFKIIGGILGVFYIMA